MVRLPHLFCHCFETQLILPNVLPYCCNLNHSLFDQWNIPTTYDNNVCQHQSLHWKSSVSHDLTTVPGWKYFWWLVSSKALLFVGVGRWSRIAVEKVLFGVFTGGDAHVSLGNPASRATDGLIFRLSSDEHAFFSAIC